jgi:hypothetical protein
MRYIETDLETEDNIPEDFDEERELAISFYQESHAMQNLEDWFEEMSEDGIEIFFAPPIRNFFGWVTLQEYLEKM